MQSEKFLFINLIKKEEEEKIILHCQLNQNPVVKIPINRYTSDRSVHFVPSQKESKRMMNTVLISILIVLNLSIYLAMPNVIFHPTDSDYHDIPERQISKRLQLSPWTAKRDRTLCDYRLQLRPLPYLSTLCGYSSYRKKKRNYLEVKFVHFVLGQHTEDIHRDEPFKYG